MTTAVELQSVVLDDRGRPIIAGTRFKVLLLAMEHIYWNLSAEELQAAYPQLTLPQVYAALAYYYEHKDEVDAEIAAGNEEYERLREASKDSPLRQRLRGKGLIP